MVGPGRPGPDGRLVQVDVAGVLMTARDVVVALAPVGLPVTEMAEIATVSRQRVQQILASEPDLHAAWRAARDQVRQRRETLAATYAVPAAADRRFARSLGQLRGYLWVHGHAPGVTERWDDRLIGMFLARLRDRRDELGEERRRALTALGVSLEADIGVRITTACPLPHDVPHPTAARVAREAPVRAMLAALSDRQIEQQTGIDRKKIGRLRRGLGLPRWQPAEPAHGTSGRWRRCDCETCREARAVYAAAEYARSGRTTTKGPLSADRAAVLHQQRRAALARTAAAATKRGPWTPDELAVALDLAHSAEQAALLLGRSKSAVEHQRARRKSALTASGPLPRGRRAAR